MSRGKILLAVAALGVLVILLSRGEEPSSRLQVLRDDPMADYAPPGGTLIDTKAQNEGRSLGEPVPATYTRLFRFDADAEPGRVLEDARSAATAAGWTPFGQATEETFVGSKRVVSGRLVLTLSLEGPAFSISLRHLGG